MRKHGDLKSIVGLQRVQIKYLHKVLTASRGTNSRAPGGPAEKSLSEEAGEMHTACKGQEEAEMHRNN